jgi:DsbC/DsbD-like thiol-disulfide interchange protein
VTGDGAPGISSSKRGNVITLPTVDSVGPRLSRSHRPRSDRLFNQRMIVAILAWTLVPALSHAQSVVTTPHLRGAIKAGAPRANQPLRVHVTLDVSPGWHIGAPHNGTTDLPTRLSWRLPKGWSVLNTSWPQPKRLIAGRDTTFTFAGRVEIDAMLEASSAKDRGSVGVVVSYGVCRDVCIPGHMLLTLER